ncbi:MAG: VCBS repeat-containing protein [Phycisphaerales bacterium]|nr:VCBS repeat-containing protein [Phycisphaerales bacterium]
MRHFMTGGVAAFLLATGAGAAEPCEAPRTTAWAKHVIPLASAPAYEGFGTLLSANHAWVAAGDVDADGHDDIVFAAPDCTRFDCFESAGAGGPGAGRAVVVIVSGRTGEVIGELVQPGPRANAGFGWDIAVVDLDGDDHADIVVSEAYRAVDITGDDQAEPEVGAVHIFSGASGGLARTINGTRAGGRFGIRMAVVGDWSGDGTRDLLVAEQPSLTAVHDLYVYSGADGSLLGSVASLGAGLARAAVISNIGDVSGDGQDDAAIATLSAPGSPFEGFRMVASIDFGIAASVPFPEPAASRPTRVGDVDGDGRADLVIRGYAGIADDLRAFSGATGDPIAAFSADQLTPGTHCAFAPVGDVNGDGVPDVAVGPALLEGESPSWERLRVHSLADGACLGHWQTMTLASAEAELEPEVSLANAYSSIVSGDFDGDGLLDVASVGILHNQSAAPYYLYQLNIFRRPGCPEDMTGDGFIGFADLSALLDTFNDMDAPGMLPADIDGNGRVDFSDLNLILAAFNSGC